MVHNAYVKATTKTEKQRYFKGKKNLLAQEIKYSVKYIFVGHFIALTCRVLNSKLGF